MQLVPLCREACSRADSHTLASLENGSRLNKLCFSNISETHNYLQTLGLLGETLEHDEVARFLRHCPGLSKQTIGDLLGENDQFFLDVLDAFTGTFSFRGAHPCTMMVFWASMVLTYGACKPLSIPCLQHTAVWSKTQDKAMLTSSQRSDPSVQVCICAGVEQKSAMWT